MKKFIIAAFLSLMALPAYCGQMSLLGAGKVTVASYVGPGNVVASPTYYWGLRCRDSSYVGNVADVYAPADASHTLITCTSGGVLNETIQSIATTCAVSCTVKTLYEQVSGTSHFEQATEALRPAYTASCSGGKPCMTFVRASSQFLGNVSNPASLSQPYTVSAVAVRTGTLGSESEIIGTPGAALAFNAGAAQVFLFAGGFNPVSAADSVIHALQAVGNGASGFMTVDATQNSVNNGAAAIFGGTTRLGTNSTQYMDGKIFEVGVWPIAFSGTQMTNMCNNQFVYWTTGVSC